MSGNAGSQLKEVLAMPMSIQVEAGDSASSGAPLSPLQKLTPFDGGSIVHSCEAGSKSGMSFVQKAVAWTTVVAD